jgi:hypothetical protein
MNIPHKRLSIAPERSIRVAEESTGEFYTTDVSGCEWESETEVNEPVGVDPSIVKWGSSQNAFV